jgi:hypothetical protein
MSEARKVTPPDVARKELREFLRMAERVGMDTDRQRHSLGLSRDDWQSWLGILHDAPMPRRPALPTLLQSLGHLTSELDRAARQDLGSD